MNCATLLRGAVPLPASTVPYTPMEQAVGELLLPGAANAITIAELEKYLLLSPRAIKKAVRGLRVRHRIPVCGEKGDGLGGSGYYIADTAEEIERACNLLMDQALSMLQAAAAIPGRGRIRIKEKLGQLRLAIDTLEWQKT